MKRLFNRTVEESSVNFQKRSQEILGVFTQTKNDLAELNAEQNSYITKLDEEVARLNTEKAAAEASVKENANIVKKIEDFLK